MLKVLPSDPSEKLLTIHTHYIMTVQKNSLQYTHYIYNCLSGRKQSTQSVDCVWLIIFYFQKVMKDLLFSLGS